MHKQKHERKIIDVCFHAIPYPVFGTPSPPNPVTGSVPSFTSTTEQVDSMLTQLRKYNIVKVITSGPLDFVAQYKKADPERIIGGIQVGFPVPLPDTSTLIKLINDGTIKVFGEIFYEYDGKTLADSSLIPYLNICEKMKIPVEVHMALGPPGISKQFRTRLGNPQLIEDVLVSHPDLKVLIMHAGYPYLQEMKAILNNYPQVSVDISVVNWVYPIAEFHNYLKGLIDAGYEKRIMFGTDGYLWPDVVKLSVENVENVPFLSEEQKQDIFYNNASKFFNIP